MKRALCLIPVLAGVLWGQSVDVYGQILNTHLRELLKNNSADVQASASGSFTQDLSNIANRFKQHPSNAALARFSARLVQALAGTNPQPTALRNVTTQIVSVLINGVRSHASLATFQKDLTAVGIDAVKAEAITASLKEIGTPRLAANGNR